MNDFNAGQQKISGVLVTGANGYIGKSFVNQITPASGAVVTLDKFDGVVRPGVDHYVGDFGDEIILNKILRRYDIHSVIHLAALKSVSESIVDPLSYLEVNYVKTMNMFRVLSEVGLQRMIFASSAAVYAEKISRRNPLISESDKILPASPYGVSKIAAEYFLESACQSYQSVVALRIFNVAGIYPGLTISSGAVNMLCDIAVNGGTFHLKRNSKGGTTLDSVRDYISVGEVASAISAVLDSHPTPGFSAVNICSGVGTSIKDLIALVEEKFGKKIQVVQSDKIIDEASFVVGNPILAFDKVGFSSKESLDSIVGNFLLNVCRQASE